tara:strand:- start:2093 stop:4261 length:2169 start_codon:yes stop_codon:yes gene_type:complete
MPNQIKIILNLPIYKSFDYLVPKHFRDLRPGMRVEVPFGTKNLIGITITDPTIRNISENKYKLKNINKVIDLKPIITNEVFKICKWSADYYQHPLGQVIFSSLPSKIKKGGDLEIKENQAFLLKVKKQTDDTYFKNKPAQYRLFKNIESSGTVRSDIIKPSNLINLLLSNNLIEKSPIEDKRINTKKIRLSEEQNDAYKLISKKISFFQAFLIEGVTGSGKTELYIKIAKDIVNKKGQVLIVVPEINLTPQTINRFKSYLNCSISSYHSGLSDKVKNNTWIRAKNGQVDIIIGTRSSIYLPFSNLKLIIVDEEHDVSLKQSDVLRYHARDVAIIRAKNLNIPILMGSATPSFESLYNCKKTKYDHIILKSRFFNTKLPSVTVIDTNKDQPSEGFSMGLIKEIKETLKNKKQTLLFINRRGFSHTLLCKTCGWTSKCDNCDAFMTYHDYDSKLYCHHCGYQKKVNLKNICSCDKRNECNIIPLGAGTERVETKAKSLFPHANIMRIDSDTINNIDKLNSFLNQARDGKIDILIGTQMLVKGHDFPNLTLVGVMDIDAGLYSLDFRSIEKIAQMLIQVSGRSGRHDSPGKVIIQTRKPGHPLMSELLEYGYNGFSNKALEDRNHASLPPYSYLALFRVSTKYKGEGLIFLSKIKNKFNENNIKLLGPSPSPIHKKNNRYFYQLLVNSNNRKFLLQKSTEIREYIMKQKKSNIKWSIDIDPIDLY